MMSWFLTPKNEQIKLHDENEFELQRNCIANINNQHKFCSSMASIQLGIIKKRQSKQCQRKKFRVKLYLSVQKFATTSYIIAYIIL